MEFKKILLLLVIFLIFISDVISLPVTGTKCSCGLTLIVVCPGAFQCWDACKNYTSWYTACVLNEGNMNHYCECFGEPKTNSSDPKLAFLQ